MNADPGRPDVARGVQCWFVDLPPQTLATARQLPQWEEMVADGRLFLTALAAVRAFRSEHSTRPGAGPAS